MNNIYYVYEWIRLDTNEPFYVGKGKGNRAYELKKNRNKYFKNIVNKINCAVVLLKNNLEEEIAFEYEKRYIDYYKYEIGYNLVNMTDGGEGVSGYKPSEKNLKENRSRINGFDMNDYTDEILDMYINKKMNTREIGNYFKTSHRPILRILNENNVTVRYCSEINEKLTGFNRYNSIGIIVKDIYNNIVNVSQSMSICANWLLTSNIYLTNKSARRYISKIINTNLLKHGLNFTSCDKKEYDIYKKLEIKNFNLIDYTSKFNEGIIIVEVFNNKGNLIEVFDRIELCEKWLVDNNTHSHMKAARKAINKYKDYQKLEKYKYCFKIYSPSDYFLKYNKLPN